jgi:hypothetical protein
MPRVHLLLVALIVLGNAAPSRAQEKDPVAPSGAPASPPPEDAARPKLVPPALRVPPEGWKRYFASGDSMRDAGVTLTLMGMIGTLAGTAVVVAVLMDKASRCGSSSPDGCAAGDVSAALLVGVPLLVIGASGLASGIPLWIVGERRRDQARPYLGVSFAPHRGPDGLDGGGLVLNARF